MAEPKVRFKRDDGSSYPAWEYIPFGDIYKKVIEKNDLSFGRDKMISVANMYFKESDSRDVLDDDYMKTYNIMRLGDIAFEGNKSKFFAHGRFVENTIGDGIVSHVFDVFRPTRPYILAYWKEYINYEPIMGKVLLRCTKSSTMMTNLAADDFLQQKIFVPCLEEQQKIADFLSTFDEIISTSEQEVANLEIQKKAVMKKIFSQEVRFKRADGSDFPEWGRDVLDNLCEYRRGSFPQPYGLEEWYDENEGMPFIQVADVNDDMSVNPDTKRHISELAKPMSVFIPKGTLIITLQGTIGRVAITSYDAYVDRTLLLFQKVSDELLLDYFKYALFMCFNEEKKTADGGIIKTITKETLGSFVIPLPCIEEQRLIADFLSDFDEAIAAAKKELELWKELKKGLLRQMFV